MLRQWFLDRPSLLWPSWPRPQAGGCSRVGSRSQHPAFFRNHLTLGDMHTPLQGLLLEPLHSFPAPQPALL